MGSGGSKCVFCDVTKEKGFDIIHETDDLVVFRDIRPAATEHLLVVTRKHVGNVKTLRTEDVPLVRAMETAGVQALTALGVPRSQQRFGYHIPPFNTVEHLHLHALGLPFRLILHRWKYPIAHRPGGKGFSWFAEVHQVYDVLARDAQIRVRSC